MGQIEQGELATNVVQEQNLLVYSKERREDLIQDFVVPNFIKKDQKVAGASLGTVYHTVLESMDFISVDTMEDIEKKLEQLIHIGKLTLEQKKEIRVSDLHRFMQSDLANRMRKAKANGKLYKERQFIMGIEAKEISVVNEGAEVLNKRSDDLVLVQGIIDAYFEEEGALVLMDYKTDHVLRTGGEELLRKRYQIQLDYYQKAIEQITGKKVKEKVIYSFALGKEIKWMD